jgi:hypothetical protein
MRLALFSVLPLVAGSLAWAGGARGAEPLRAGIIGCDTSHVPAFAKLLNDDAANGAAAKYGVRVTAAFPGGSPDLADSRDRVPGYVKALQGMGVTIVDSIEELVAQCDVILLESVDGRVHLAQFRQAAVGKPVFVDKPAARRWRTCGRSFAWRMRRTRRCSRRVHCGFAMRCGS